MFGIENPLQEFHLKRNIYKLLNSKHKSRIFYILLLTKKKIKSEFLNLNLILKYIYTYIIIYLRF